MLDAFIIEELRRREDLERGHAEQPRMELPLDESRPRIPHTREDKEPGSTPERGVIVIDF